MNLCASRACDAVIRAQYGIGLADGTDGCLMPIGGRLGLAVPKDRMVALR
jgi:hypothetical protein